MSYCFIISNRRPFLRRLSRILRNETLYDPICIPLSPEQKNPVNLEPANYENPVSLFKYIEEQLDAIPTSKLRSAVVVVDELISISRKFLDPLTTRSGPQQFYAMLMLAFPELQFVFLNTTGLPSERMYLLNWLESAKSRDRSKSFQECQLFDPYGLRGQIKSKLDENKEHPNAPPAFDRDKKALSIEEELSYALYNGYAAYKSGYTCTVVNSLGHLENIRKNYSSSLYFLQYEDLYLNFYDRTDKDDGLSSLKKRDNGFPFLKKADGKKRFLVSVAHSELPEEDKERVSNIIPKPGRGIYELLKEAKEAKSSELQYYINKRDAWLTKIKESKSEATNKTKNHSAPGRLMVVAESLLDRAEKLLNNGSNVPDAIHSATLALEAKELLGCHTPTLAIQALSLQHQAEITAESAFFGVEYSLQLEDRFEDIKAEAKTIAEWFAPRIITKQQLNIRLSIIEQLAKKFNAFNQFEEEQVCLHEARGLTFSLYRRKRVVISLPRVWSREKNPIEIRFRFGKIRQILRPVHWYIQCCLSSLWNFTLWILFWILFFAFWYHCAVNGNWPNIDYDSCIDYEAFISASRFFVTFETSTYLGEGLKNLAYKSTILTIQGVVAFSHLTILATYIYSKLSRR